MIFQRYKIVPGCEPDQAEKLGWLATGIKVGSNPGLHECVKQAFEFIYEGMVVEHDGQEDLDVDILLSSGPGGHVA